MRERHTPLTISQRRLWSPTLVKDVDTAFSFTGHDVAGKHQVPGKGRHVDIDIGGQQLGYGLVELLAQTDALQEVFAVLRQAAEVPEIGVIKAGQLSASSVPTSAAQWAKAKPCSAIPLAIAATVVSGSNSPTRQGPKSS